MKERAYTERDMLRVSRRLNNTKRSYLLVNPLQGKHHPSRPEEALAMMGALGDAVATTGAERAPALVIGFAETATAVGAAVAARLGPLARYITTTREQVPGVAEWLHFQEEHSHAVEQKLCADGLDAPVGAGAGIVIVDDELSTGKTLRNIAARLRERYPELAGRRFLAASLINRLSGENMARLTDAGIDCVSLLRLPEGDCAAIAESYEIEPPVDVRGRSDLPAARLECAQAPGERDASGLPGSRVAASGGSPLGLMARLPDVRRGVDAAEYARRCAELARELAATEALRALAGRSVQVLGTEEFMYPALLLARELSRFADVRVHATTRSPIGVCASPGYPITNGCLLRSCYDPARPTYVYDLSPCDATVAFTDAAHPEPGLEDLSRAICHHGCNRLIAIRSATD